MSNRDATFGASIDLSTWKMLPLRALLFGEAQGRAIISTSVPAEVMAIAVRHGVPARVIGTVQPSHHGLRIVVGDRTIDIPLDGLSDAYHEAIPRAMRRSPAETVSSELAAGVLS